MRQAQENYGLEARAGVTGACHQDGEHRLMLCLTCVFDR